MSGLVGSSNDHEGFGLENQERGDASKAARPRLRLFTETLLVNEGTRLAPSYREVEAAVLSVSFEGASDGALEARARYIVESFGASDLGCLEDVHAPPGSGADYIIDAGGDVHAVCAFSAYAVPQLRRLGWHIEVDRGYPYEVVGGEGADGDQPLWYARLDKDESAADCLNLELGIEVGGRKLNLLPPLLDLLNRAPAGARLDALVPSGRCFALSLGGGRYVAVPPERLRLLLTVLRDLYDGEGGGDVVVRFPETRLASLGRLAQGFKGGFGMRGWAPGGAATAGGGFAWEGAAALAARAQALAAGAQAPGDGAAGAPPGLNATLRPYQEVAVRWLQHLRAHGVGGVLADDMGLGKTLETIAHIVTEKAAGRLDGPALVVAPTSLLPNWRRELARFAPRLRVIELYGAGRSRLWQVARLADVALTTYTVLARDEERLAGRVFPMLVLDEAQAIKNARSRLHRAAEAVNARQRICLTGTPLENNLGELWALFDLLLPGLLGDEEGFRRRYAVPIEREGSRERLEALREQVAPYILRRTKEQVTPELPPKTEIIRPVELRGAQRDLYESLRLAAHSDVRRLIQKKGLGASTVTILDALMKLRQCCCDPRLLKLGTLISAEAPPVGPPDVVRESAKYDLFFELLGQQLERGRRVLVFSQFTSMLALLAHGLKERGIRYAVLTGSTADRRKPVEAFERREMDVFLISLKAGGTGLNLTSADTVIHYDPWWNPAAQAQATDRAHRIGQTRPVFVFKLIVAGSVEEHMLRLQEKKRALADGVFGPGAAGGLRFSVDDVENLFAPLAREDT